MTQSTSNPVPPAGTRSTVRDVAERAGVSKSLVSLAFKAPERVSGRRLERIKSAARELGYQPNFLARTLAAQGAPFVAILVVNLHNPVFAEIADAVRAELDAHGEYGLITSATMPDADSGGDDYGRIDERVIAMLADLRPRALIVIGTVAEADPLLEGIATVYASAAPQKGAGYASVRVDDSIGMSLVIEHLASRGHERIAFVGGMGGAVSRGREVAYREAMGVRALEPSVCEAGFSEDEGRRAGRELLRSVTPPTAIVAVNDIAAIGVLAAADEAGRAVPGEVAVAGFDNSSLTRLGRISLTSVDPQNREIGRLSAAVALRAMAHPASDAEELLITPHLVVRNSTLARGRE